MKKIFTLAMLSVLSIGSNTLALAQSNSITSNTIENSQKPITILNELKNSVVIENDNVNLPDNFTSDFSFVKNNINLNYSPNLF